MAKHIFHLEKYSWRNAGTCPGSGEWPDERRVGMETEQASGQQLPGNALVILPVHLQWACIRKREFGVWNTPLFGLPGAGLSRSGESGKRGRPNIFILNEDIDAQFQNFMHAVLGKVNVRMAFLELVDNGHFRLGETHGNGIGELDIPGLFFTHQLVDEKGLGDGNAAARGKPGVHGTDGNPALFRQPLARLAVGTEPFLDFKLFRIAFFRSGRSVQIRVGNKVRDDMGKRFFSIGRYLADAHLCVKRLWPDSYLLRQLVGLAVLALQPFLDHGAYIVVRHEFVQVE